ncbi:MAG: ABC transporter permease, partial [Gemmatimonadales bacterium]|nr:ABC transporter permease [Gemmatimonadales bacterium]
ARLGARATVTRRASGAGRVTLEGARPRVTPAQAIDAAGWALQARAMPVLAGAPFTADEWAGRVPAAMLSRALADSLAGAGRGTGLVGRTVQLGAGTVRVAAVLGSAEGRLAPDGMPMVLLPLALHEAAAAPLLPPESVEPPVLLVRARAVEEVQAVKADVERWLEAREGPGWRELARVEANGDARLAQMRQGMLIFRLLMGSFAAIALVVGGIGIMNVLLASVIERTREIGIRRAAGARARDILLQLLSESVAITGVGSVLGAALGLGAAFAATAVMRAKTGALLFAAFTWPTVLAAAGVSVVVGLVFGTYPALRGARLSPVEAMRHE